MKWFVSGVLLLAGLTGVAAWHMFPAASGTTPDSTGLSLPGEAREVQGIGHVEPASEMRQLMFRSGGVIRCCRVRAGDRIGQGQLLMELDSAAEQAEVEVARRQRELAEADAVHVRAGVNPYRLRAAERTAERLQGQHRHCCAEAERLRALYARRAVSLQDLEAMETRRIQAEAALREQEAEVEHLKHFVTPEQRALLEARVRHARAALGQAEQKLRDTQLLAPFDGTVLKLLKREGEGVRLFEPEAVLLFGDLSRLRVRAEIDERFVRELAVGQEASIFGRNLGERSYRGRVVEREQIMGDKTVFTRASSERKDLDVLQVLIEMGPDFQAPVGLQVDVRIEVSAP